MIACRRSRYFLFSFLILSLTCCAAAQGGDTSESHSQAISNATQLPSECITADRFPPEIQQRISAQPSAALYDQLGLEFGRKGDYKCATAAFEAALAIDPRSAQARYDLALA